MARLQMAVADAGGDRIPRRRHNPKYIAAGVASVPAASRGFNSGCPRFWLMLNLFLKKLEEKFGAKEKVLTFAVPSETHWFHEHGSLAQLVQSVCLTSRGSGVRLPQLPPQRTRRFSGSFFVSQSFSHFSFRLCRSRDWTEWTGTVWAAEATSDNEQVYFHIGKSN